MRTYGRIYDRNGKNPKWVQISTDANGFNDYVYITTLIQVLKLNLGESPFWANYGIPAKNAVLQQIAPDFYAIKTQQQFSGYFANLIITPIKIVTNPSNPTYQVNITTHSGAKFQETIAV